jgi:FtsZ-binding cell division protein ZapB
MKELHNKTHMDDEAEKTIGRLKEKVKATLDLFLRNRNTGTTNALKAAIATSDSPLLLSGEKEQGRKVIKDTESDIEYLDVSGEALSWSSMRKEKARGKKRQLIVDNSFMLRAMDSIASVIDFMWSEIQRLKEQNDDLREANSNLARANEKANKKVKQLTKKHEALSERVETLQDKLKSFRNGEQ